MADPTDTESSEPDPDSPKGLRARIEEANRRAAEAEQKATTLERGLAISRARLDGLSEKQLRALDAAHEGDYTPESLRATADELGFVWESSNESPTTPARPEPDHSDEARTLADLTGSTADRGNDPTTKNQDWFDQQVRGFDNPADLRAWLLENQGMLHQNE